MSMVRVRFPKSEQELSTMIQEPGAVIINGGTDLMVQMRAGKKKPALLVSLEHLPVGQGIYEEKNWIGISCRTTFADILRSKVISLFFPILTQASAEVGSSQIRNRATLVGNLVNASPAGDGILALILLDAEIEVHREPEDSYRTPLEQFILGPGKTILQAGEFVHSIRIPKPLQPNHQFFVKVGKRKAMAISIASMGAVVRVEDQIIQSLRLGFGSVGPKVIQIHEAEGYARGTRLDPDTLKVIGGIVGHSIQPIDDVRATAKYRRMVCENLVQKIFFNPSRYV